MTDGESNGRTEPFTFDQAANLLREYADRIRKLETEYKTAVEDSANAEALYRKTFGERFEHHRGEGLAVEAATVAARKDTWNLERERVKAAGAVRLALEKLEDRRGERGSLNRLVEWSGALAVLSGKKRASDDPYA